MRKYLSVLPNDFPQIGVIKRLQSDGWNETRLWSLTQTLMVETCAHLSSNDSDGKEWKPRTSEGEHERPLLVLGRNRWTSVEEADGAYIGIICSLSLAIYPMGSGMYGVRENRKAEITHGTRLHTALITQFTRWLYSHVFH